MAERAQFIAPLTGEQVAELAWQWTLHPRLAWLIAGLWFECKRRGFTIQLESGWRDTQLQKQLYDAWIKRGKTGLPAARPGTSKHERNPAEAADFRIPSGHVKEFGEIAERLGLRWGGRFQRPDPVHVELP